VAKRTYSKEWYKQALQGVADKQPGEYQGLRKYATGFGAKEGYSLKNIDNWTPYQKRKVREYAKEAHELQARSNVVYHTRSKEKLELAQKAGQHSAGHKQFKVAFLPYTPAKSDPSAKPVVTVSKTAVKIQAKYYDKVLFPFDKKALVRNAELELARVLVEAGSQGYRHFTIAAGKHQIINIHDPEAFINAALRLMAKYDGYKAIPQRSGNHGDNPKEHHWKMWLEGAIAYKFKPGETRKSLLKDMESARRERRLERDRKRKRKGKK